MSAPGSPDQQRTVLVAEDAPGDYALLREAFLALRRRADTPAIALEHAADGLAAWRRLEAGEPRVDLLVLDLHLPGLDGRGVLAQAAALPRRVPIMVITGSVRRVDRDDCLRLGAAHFARKPSFFGEWLALAEIARSFLQRETPRANSNAPSPLGSATLV